MEKCKYCNSSMIGETETKRDKTYDFFYNCPNCKSIYEGSKDKNNIIIKSRWWNNQNKQFENIINY